MILDVVFFFLKRSRHTSGPARQSGRATPFCQHDYQNGYASFSCTVSFSFIEKQNGFNKRYRLQIASAKSLNLLNL